MREWSYLNEVVIEAVLAVAREQLARLRPAHLKEIKPLRRSFVAASISQQNFSFVDGHRLKQVGQEEVQIS